MPLPNNLWERGKCGLKILQYLSVGIPSVVSNVGINSKIIHNGKNGYVVNNNKQWEACLLKLLNNPQSIIEMGFYGRKVVEKKFFKFFNNLQIIINLKEINCIFILLIL